MDFTNVLKKLADRIEEHNIEEVPIKQLLLNRIDLRGFREMVKQYTKDRSLCKKQLKVDGDWRLNLQYGPQFETKLMTERAGAITVQTDETILLGGGGTALHPISLCLAGFCGCFSAAFAKWAAMDGIELNKFRIRAQADIDLTTSIGIEDNFPMVDNYQLDLIVDTDADMDQLNKIVEFTKIRCFCYYCITYPIFPRLKLTKVVNDNPELLTQNLVENNQGLTFSENSIINRINLDAFKETKEVLSQNRSLCKKTLAVEGKWRLGVNYGPQFEITLPTERAGEKLIQTDETLILGGGGTSFHPVALCISGMSACVQTAFAKWAAMEGIILKELKTKAKMDIDLTTGFGIEDNIPMIDDFEVEFLVESDASTEKLQKILEIVKKRSFCYYCYLTPTFPDIIVRKETAEQEILILKKPVVIEQKRKEITPEKIHLIGSHNLKMKTKRVIKMTTL